jgi:hypothetical protein
MLRQFRSVLGVIEMRMRQNDQFHVVLAAFFQNLVVTYRTTGIDKECVFSIRD